MTESTWPTHEDGTNKRIGDMTADEKRAVMAAAKKRFMSQADEREEQRMAQEWVAGFAV